jgi:hypothetical protein
MTKLSGGTADDFVAQYIPLKRMGTKGDIALTAVFLARSHTPSPAPRPPLSSSPLAPKAWHVVSKRTQTRQHSSISHVHIHIQTDTHTCILTRALLCFRVCVARLGATLPAKPLWWTAASGCSDRPWPRAISSATSLAGNADPHPTPLAHRERETGTRAHKHIQREARVHTVLLRPPTGRG